MRTNALKLAAVAAVGTLGVGAPRATADSLELTSTFSGGIYADGTTSPGFMNYYVGYSFPSSPVERRNYFIFDVSSVPGPVVSAKLKLYLPGAPFFPSGYVSSDPTEEFRVSGSAFPWTAYAEAFGGTATPPMLAAMFGTMGSSDAYGLVGVSGDASGTDIVIDLSLAAVTAINASPDGKFLVTGKLADIHPGMPGTIPSELLFAYTDIPDPLMPMPRLEVEYVPAPRSMLVLGAGCLLARRRRR
ncbi:MAG: hypothetical protein SFY69_03770 [Planctomycetota bacterium]|nr:hypothetical protein [Planctomycetota bacterium]